MTFLLWQSSREPRCGSAHDSRQNPSSPQTNSSPGGFGWFISNSFVHATNLKIDQDDLDSGTHMHSRCVTLVSPSEKEKTEAQTLQKSRHTNLHCTTSVDARCVTNPNLKEAGETSCLSRTHEVVCASFRFGPFFEEIQRYTSSENGDTSSIYNWV